jgi:hypothetical protein
MKYYPTNELDIESGLKWVCLPASMEDALKLPDGSVFRLALNKDMDKETVLMKVGDSLFPILNDNFEYNKIIEDEYEEIDELV